MSNWIGLMHIGTLPQALAHVGLVWAVLYYMKVGALFDAYFGVLENVAAALLLRRYSDGVGRAHDGASVTRFDGGKVITANIRGDLQAFRQAVFIFNGMTPVSPRLPDSCDVYKVFGKPAGSLVRSAYSVFYLGDITKGEAELIVRSDIATLLRPGRSIGQSLTRLRSLAELPPAPPALATIPSVNRHLGTLR